MQLSDKTTGLVMVVIGAAAWYGGSLLAPVPGQQVGPSVFPMIIGAGLAICGVLIACGVGSSIEKSAEEELVAHSDADMLQEPKGSKLAFVLKTLLPPALLMFYVAVADRLGFVPTAMIMVLAIALTMGAKLRMALPLALIAPVLVHLIFLKLLRVPLPPGVLPMPWG